MALTAQIVNRIIRNRYPACKLGAGQCMMILEISLVRWCMTGPTFCREGRFTAMLINDSNNNNYIIVPISAKKHTKKWDSDRVSNGLYKQIYRT